MNQMTTAKAIRHILGAHGPADVFAGEPAVPADTRRAKRHYRTLVALIHPDLARANGAHIDDAQRATARLNQLYDQWLAGASASAAKAGPHVVGQDAVYRLRQRIRQAKRFSTYATDTERTFVAISRTPGPATSTLRRAHQRLARAGMQAFGPALVDRGSVGGREWVAYSLPDGLHTLREVRDAYPAGLDGRDWAWMARRLFMTLDAATVAHGNLGLDTVLIHPEERGVVLIGWGDDDHPDGQSISDLFDAMLSSSEHRQRTFARQAVGLAPGRRLGEYDLLLQALYGPRRFRPFTMPPSGPAA
ncbi:hypothetical protein [Tessaracoccus caeni]|uniref:hypothetical protein n=1 Tax=Tessaracoccus caeni TaxID=3031239 RepID=UPI0023D9A105|nr:hypothetical protein [Tessaracoccus caeni]MDF1487452.1 hypothetical protein [Tessaracoccus caeni]